MGNLLGGVYVCMMAQRWLFSGVVASVVMAMVFDLLDGMVARA